MEKSFRYLWMQYTETLTLLQNEQAREDLAKLNVRDREYSAQLEKKVNFYEKKLKEFGSGIIIQITGKYWKEPDKRDKIAKLTDFELLLVNTEMNEAKEYFKVFMQYNSIKFEKATIQFKEIKTNKLLTI
jgi:hypothetical protein